MDVNNVRQNTINFNSYNSNLSEYAETNAEMAIPQVQKVETQASESDNSKNQEYNKNDLDKALRKLNNFLKDERTHAEYSVHKDLGTIMIKVVDEDTKEVILEVPPQKILDMIASMCKQVGLIDKKA